MIDLRSDFCAPPTEEMWSAMREAEIGWPSGDGRDTVGELERTGAELLGKEAALFTGTCSQANLVALLALGRPGERVALAPDTHALVNEGGWLTEVTKLLPVGLEEDAPLAILENTHTRSGGTVLSPERTRELAARADRVHLDGARLPNAAAAAGVSLAELAAPADTVALSLNKGLCAPYGALLLGPVERIETARGHLRQLGGGTVHKGAILAAAGLAALGLVERIADDNRRARDLAELLELPRPETNIVLTELDEGRLPELASRGVLAFAPGGGPVRLVTHRGIGDAEVEQAAAAVRAVRPGLRPSSTGRRSG